MKKIDITKEIMSIHEQDLIDEVSREVEEELKGGIPAELLAQADNMIQLAEERIIKEGGQVVRVSFGQKKQEVSVASDQMFHAEFELRAAASEEVEQSKWYKLYTKAVGFNIELSPIMDEEAADQQVKVVLTKGEGGELCDKLFEGCSGKDVKLVIEYNGQPALEAELYVRPGSYRASGEGVVLLEELDESRSFGLRWEPL